MTDPLDPLDALYSPVMPVHPDREFADRLRDRLRAKVLDPMGATMSTPTAATATTATTANALTPYLAVRDGAAAIRWYRDVLGAVPRGEPYLMDDGRVGHAELVIQGALLMLADAFPEYGYQAPGPGDPFYSSLNLEVPNVDIQFRRAVDAGATVERAPVDQFHGRSASVIDPFGHRWMFHAGSG